jgi:hypothetical protein
MRPIWLAVALAVLAFAAAGCGGSGSSTSTQAVATTATSSECADVTYFGANLGAAVASIGGAGGASRQTADALDKLVKAAPDELKQDFVVLTEAVNRIEAALKGVNLKAGETPSTAQKAKLALIGKSLRTGKAKKASADIAVWRKKHCSSQ